MFDVLREIVKLNEANDVKARDLDRRMVAIRLDQDRRITQEERRRIHRLVNISDERIDRLSEAQRRGLLESAPPADEFSEFETIEIEDAIN